MPIAFLAFESTAKLLYAKHRVRKLFEDESEETGTLVRLATFDKIREHGVTGLIWEET